MRLQNNRVDEASSISSILPIKYDASFLLVAADFWAYRNWHHSSPMMLEQ